MKRVLPLIFPSILLLFLKFFNLDIRISDTNIYFYTAKELLEGKFLYKDIFFTNFPLFPYISSFYFLIMDGRLDLFFLTPTLEIIVIAFIIYLIIFQKTKSFLSSFTTSSLYLFSFLVLSTSDHQTGVFLASIFSLIAYYFFEKKHLFVSGIFIAFAILIKAYFLPVLLSLFIALLLKEKKKTIKFIAGFFITFFIILLPFLIFAGNEFIKDVFKYSLVRSAGISKTNLAWFFISHDFIFFIILIFNLLNIRKSLFFGIFSISSFLFFIIYRDIYYLYLNFMAPFLALSFPSLNDFTNQKLHLQKAVLPTFVIIFSLINIILYLSSYKDLQKINNVSEIIKIIKTEKPEFLYGVNDITPALSYFSETPLLDNIIDTNENIFRKGILDANLLTKKAIKQKSIIVSHGVSYKEAGIEESLIDGIFDKETVKKSCRLILSSPVQSEGVINRINLLKCY